MHIFLTGHRGVGKSSLINTVLNQHPCLRLGGFRTVTRADVPGALGSVYIVPAGNDRPDFGPDCRIGIRHGPPRGADRFPQTFETRGVELLEDARNTELIIMDEIGFMESAAPAFSASVLTLLGGSTPILGVLRQQGDSPLQMAIRSHPAVRLMEVTQENRDALVREVEAWAQALPNLIF